MRLIAAISLITAADAWFIRTAPCGAGLRPTTPIGGGRLLWPRRAAVVRRPASNGETPPPDDGADPMGGIPSPRASMDPVGDMLSGVADLELDEPEMPEESLAPEIDEEELNRVRARNFESRAPGGVGRSHAPVCVRARATANRGGQDPRGGAVQGARGNRQNAAVQQPRVPRYRRVHQHRKRDRYRHERSP